LAVPAELDGRVGTFRSKEPNTLGVATDLDAIYAWLQRRADKPATIQQYGRLLERFYLWCLWVKKKCLGDLVESDFHDYKAFLRAP
ncbi:integrase, partial [Acinetobacter baumannii]